MHGVMVCIVIFRIKCSVVITVAVDAASALVHHPPRHAYLISTPFLPTLVPDHSSLQVQQAGSRWDVHIFRNRRLLLCLGRRKAWPSYAELLANVIKICSMKRRRSQ